MMVAASAPIGNMSVFPLEISKSQDRDGVSDCTNQDKSPNIAGVQQSIKSVISGAAAAFKQMQVSIGPLETAINGVHWTDGIGIRADRDVDRVGDAVHWRCSA